MNNKAVIFDLDGTLYDRRGLALRMVARDPRHIFMMVRERRVRRSLAGRAFAGKEEFYDTFLNELSKMSGKRVKDVEKWYFGTYMQNMVDILGKHYKVRPWVRREIEKLHSVGMKVAVLSDYAFVREKLRAIGIAAGNFDLVADAPSCGGLKPCEDTFLKMAEDLQVLPADILVVGDRDDTDGEGARNSGMRFLPVDEYIALNSDDKR